MKGTYLVAAFGDSEDYRAVVELQSVAWEVIDRISLFQWENSLEPRFLIVIEHLGIMNQLLALILVLRLQRNLGELCHGKMRKKPCTPPRHHQIAGLGDIPYLALESAHAGIAVEELENMVEVGITRKWVVR